MGNKILVIRLSSLGDVILTAPVYKNLKAHWPDCRITVLVKPAYAGIVAGMPGVDERPDAAVPQKVGRRMVLGPLALVEDHPHIDAPFVRRDKGPGDRP